MATSRVLAAIISKTKEAIKNFVHVPGAVQSIQKQIGNVAATEAGINHSEVNNVTYNEMVGVGFYIKNHERSEKHMLLKNGAKLEYYILTEPNDVSKDKDLKRIYSLQMPQKTPAEGGGAN